MYSNYFYSRAFDYKVRYIFTFPSELGQLFTSHNYLLPSSSQPYSFLHFKWPVFKSSVLFFHLSPVWEIFAQLPGGTKCRCLSLKMEILSGAQTALLLVVACLNVYLTLWYQSCSTVVTSMEVMSKCDSTFSF